MFVTGCERGHVYCWDLDGRETVGPPVRVGQRAHIVATHVGSTGTATAFLYIPGDDDGNLG